MGRTAIDLVGHQFERLTVIARAGSRHSGSAWRCRCVCGKEIVTVRGALRRGAATSCGCRQRETAAALLAITARTHGGTRSSEYTTWVNMIQRCTNPKNPQWGRYGQRGIRIHQAWFDFENFFDDMGSRPSPKHTIDRIDNDGDYEAGNCRWATPREQGRNQSRNKFIEHDGVRRCVAEWAEVVGINDSTLRARLSHGWEIGRALTRDVRR